jgi:aminomethyltransferase
MSTASEALRRSPLHERHVALGARFGEFAGWEMPLEYAGGGVLAEHMAVRSRVGLFDVSHLGKIAVRGRGAAAFLNRCLSADLNKIGPGRAQYSLVCAADGGIVDDLIVYLRAEDDVLLVPNAANCSEVAGLLQEAAPPSVQVTNRHADFAVFAVQGPQADAVLTAAGLPAGHPYLSFVEGVLTEAGLVEAEVLEAGLAEAGLTGGGPTEFGLVPRFMVVCRTGYTGERGYELLVPRDLAVTTWDTVMKAGAAYGLRAAGLGARDTLRTEMGYPLHGQDISRSVTPVEARLGWAVGWTKPDFWGAAALRAEKESGPARLLWGLRAVGRGIPRPGMRILRSGSGHGTGGDAAGGSEVVGTVTSGTFSPTLRIGIGLGLLDSEIAEGDEVEVEVRSRREAFVVTRPPFVTPSVRS